MNDPAVKSKPFAHQQKIYEEHRDDEYFALFWEMGLGKTKTLLDVASHLFLLKKIDGLFIVASNSVYKNWLSQEMPPHLAAPYVGMAYKTKGSGSERGQLKMLFMLDPTQRDWMGKLRVVVMSYDSLITDRGFEFAKRFATIYKTMIVADESTAIKSTKAVRSKRAKSVASLCHYRWISTGTPVAHSPFDVHSQVEFLNPDFWKSHGMRTKDAFKSEFGTYQRRHLGGGREFNELVSYRRLDYLNRLLTPISSRLLKEDSEVDLPPKIYTTRTFQLSAKQRAAYDSLCEDFVAELDAGVYLEAPLAITRLIRLQQICSGFVTADQETTTTGVAGQLLAQGEEARPILDDYMEEIGAKGEDYESALRIAQHGLKYQLQLVDQRIADTTTEEKLEQIHGELARNIPIITTKRVVVDIIPPSENPRLQLLLELIAEAEPHKVIVWCRFTRDVDLICQALGDAAIRYDGSVSSSDREMALTRFRNPDDLGRVFVANVHAISQGVTLTIAKTSIYYTNSHSPEKRLQSEDRNHRIGQDVSVQIIDIAAENTCDMKLIQALIQKFDIAAQVTGDRFREWISLKGEPDD